MDIGLLARVFEINGQIAALQVSAMGMTAENNHRQSCGHSMAYTDGDFGKVSDEIKDLCVRLSDIGDLLGIKLYTIYWLARKNGREYVASKVREVLEKGSL